MFEFTLFPEGLYVSDFSNPERSSKIIVSEQVRHLSVVGLCETCF